MYCSNCGNEITKDTKFCNVCGAENKVASNNSVEKVEATQKAAEGGTAGQTVVQNNKIIYMLAYLGFLFFLPLVSCPDSKTGRFHANQGLLLLITAIVGQIVLTIIHSVLTWRLWALASLLSFAWGCCMLALMIIGMINANKGEEKNLPIIGGIRILK